MVDLHGGAQSSLVSGVVAHAMQWRSSAATMFYMGHMIYFCEVVRWTAGNGYVPIYIMVQTPVECGCS